MHRKCAARRHEPVQGREVRITGTERSTLKACTVEEPLAQAQRRRQRGGSALEAQLGS
jgi:hypothetical protein